MTDKQSGSPTRKHNKVHTVRAASQRTRSCEEDTYAPPPPPNPKSQSRPPSGPCYKMRTIILCSFDAILHSICNSNNKRKRKSERMSRQQSAYRFNYKGNLRWWFRVHQSHNPHPPPTYPLPPHPTPPLSLLRFKILPLGHSSEVNIKYRKEPRSFRVASPIPHKTLAGFLRFIIMTTFS